MAKISEELPGISDITAKLPSYRIEAQLGDGNMGVVFLAEELALGRKVALKVLAPSLANDERFRRRFIRESQMAANLDHPHVIPIYHAGEAEGLLYIAMRYVDGPDLRTLIEAKGPFTLQRTAAIIGQVAAALDAAHEEGLVHRDVKPANILVDRTAGDHCYLCDFGVTKHTSSGDGLTATGQFVGTIDYTAPEQIQGMPVDGRADVYALGGVLYQCLTGQVPFPREQSVAVVSAHLNEEPPSVTAHRPDLPSVVDLVVAKAMAKRPEQRYRTCGELAQALRTIPPSVHSGATVIQEGGGAQTPPASSIPPLQGAPSSPSWAPAADTDTAAVPAGGAPPKAPASGHWIRAHWPVVAGVAGGALLLLLLAVALWPSSPPFPTPDEQALLDHIPSLSSVNCERAPDVGRLEGAAVGVRCKPSSGAQTASYYQFRDLPRLRATYAQHAKKAGAPQAFCGDLPTDFLGEGAYSSKNVDAGRVQCHRSPDQKPVLEWTDEQLLILAQAVGADPKTLIDWWNSEDALVRPPPPPLTPDEQALVSTIPILSQVNCVHATDVGDYQGATAGVLCGPTSGAQTVWYYRFRDLASLQTVYARYVQSVGARSDSPPCEKLPPGFLAEEIYAAGGGPVALGRLACATVNGKPRIEWTHEQLLILAVAVGDDPNALMAWWSKDAGPR